jgi:histidinol dehydrogenase
VLTRLDLRGVSTGDLTGRLPRPDAVGAEPGEVVREILAEVRERGDAALYDLSERFDGVRPERLTVPRREWDAALARLDPELRAAIEAAASSIRAFQTAERSVGVEHTAGGITTRTVRHPVDRAGCYVPGGRAVYPSTVLMTVIPARVAAVGHVAVCVPPGPDGAVPDVVLAAAAVAGAHAVHPVGGAQAIAALAYGTESIRAVDVVVGPGNVYVATAKRQVAGEGRCAVPAAFAGPSEVVVVADATVPPRYAALDVVLQAEHGPGGLGWLVTWDEALAKEVEAEIGRIVEDSPRRAEVEATLTSCGHTVLVDGPEAAVAVANAIAPEHLELLCEGAEELAEGVRHAGAVFCGPWSTAAIGDYYAGPSHVLPTAGSARFAGALTPDDFTKPVHVVTVSADGLAAAAPHVVALARAEGLVAHADSVEARLAVGEKQRR